MWYAASLLLCNYRTEDGLPDWWQEERLPEAWQEKIRDYLSRTAEQQGDLPGEDSTAQRPSELEGFCRFVSAHGVAEPTECEYAHLLDYLAWRRRKGTNKRRLKLEAGRLAHFLRYLWRSAGREEDPLKGEDLYEDLDWLDDWYEEIILLVQADSEKDALTRTRQHAQELVRQLQHEARLGTAWKLIGITQICELTDLNWRDGMELFWRFLTEKEANVLARSVKRRAAHFMP